MDGLSSMASVIAVLQLTGSLVNLCSSYIQEVKDAREEIFALQQAITGLQGILQDLQRLLQNNIGKALPTSSRLVSNITSCLTDLQGLEAKLDPRKGKRLMRKLGFQVLKWPLERKEVEGVIRNLERYKSSFVLSLQVDQTSLMVAMAQNLNLGKLESAAGAGFDSFSDRDEVECLQGTRVELLQQILEWAMSPCSKSMFWLNGMAGTGKSTISRTVAKSLKDINYLGASFFFKRGEGDRGNAKKFFPTLVRQLMLRIPEMSWGVQEALRSDPEIASKSLKEQFDKLLLQPLLNIDQVGQQSPIAVIVIDALDECDHDHDIRNILQLLPRLRKETSFRLRIFLTSRPELPIRVGFSAIADDYQDIALHEVSEKITEQDIHLFLKERFAKIKHDRNMSLDWPGDDVIQKLVTMSAPLFISAATVCRYVENLKWEPSLRLAELLKDQTKYTSRMDKTYLPILSRLLDDQDSDESEQQQLVQEFQEIVGVIILLAVPLSINALSLFLGISADQISNRLDSFRSVLSVPGDRGLPVRILHLSFRDFLVQSRSIFFVDEPNKHKDIAVCCLKTMRNHLQKNICNLESPGTHTADINPQLLRQYLPAELEYSCHYWIHHLERGKLSSSELKNVLLFLQEHFLHWVEAMSLLGFASEVVEMLNLLRGALLGDRSSALSGFLQDAKRFILKNREILDKAPLQIYCAGLIFTPRTSKIRRAFKKELPNWIFQLPRVEERWSVELQALEGHSAPVWSVTFSPDGRLLASGSFDKTVRLWNTTTGMFQQSLEGHSDSVWSVAFSPDGRLLASGSDDQVIHLWDTVTGALQQTFKGHSDSIRSVAFSIDGRLASGSLDRTVRLWDTVTGIFQQKLESHSAPVWSVAFSPDGQLLASGSEDHTVCLWDTAKGVLQHILKDHSAPVLSVTFSPDGRLLASGSFDKTVCLWNTVTGILQQTLKGHLDLVWSVVFSPNGQLLASGSQDKTVRLWDTTTGELQQTLSGHSDSVWSVAFSPDGRLLALGSNESLVRLWDPATGASEQTFEGHSGWIQSVVFSPDGQVLASGSNDHTVRLWDTTTGELQQTLSGHSDSVWSVVFSPDGQLLASGSQDQTVCLWDTATGTLQQILKGHSSWIRSVAFSPNGQLLASGSEDQIVNLWDITTGMFQQKTLKGHLDAILSLAFSPDSQLLASVSRDQTVRLWNTETGALQQTLKSYLDSILSLAFSPDCRLLVSMSSNTTLNLWDTATGALRRTWNFQRMVITLKFSDDGSYLHTNLGILDLESNDDITRPLPRDVMDISIEGQRWIKMNGERILWLPAEYRASSYEIQGNRLALQHPSGRISFIGFCT